MRYDGKKSLVFLLISVLAFQRPPILPDHYQSHP